MLVTSATMPGSTMSGYCSDDTIIRYFEEMVQLWFKQKNYYSLFVNFEEYDSRNIPWKVLFLKCPHIQNMA